MLLSDYIKVYEQAIPAQICTDIIQRFEADTHRNNVAIQNPPVEGKPPDIVKSCIELNVSLFPEWKDVQDAMVQFIGFAFSKYNNDTFGTGFPEKLGYEAFFLRKYDPQRGDLYASHVDVMNHNMARRFLSVWWCLNDVEEGGGLFFPHINLTIPPKQGRLVIYPSLWMYPHEVQTPVSGPKYTIGSFLHYM